MKSQQIISKLFKLSLVICCFMAIATNILSFYKETDSFQKKKIKVQKEQTTQDEADHTEYSAYEAVVPVLQSNTVLLYYFIFKAVVVEIPTISLCTQSPPLFTRPFYRTLFRMIISPNAP